jgi:prepilin-type N-terminal cleavage/methylation domain-containing protein
MKNIRQKNGFTLIELLEVIIMKSNKGFTLIELIITIAIISILSMIAIPAYVGQQKNATRSEAYQNLSALRLLEEQFFSDNADYTAAAADTATIQGMLPGFQPGLNLNFSYQIVHDQNITAAAPLAYGASAPCFTAIATGVVGSRVEGDTFAIDCNYNKNF